MKNSTYLRMFLAMAMVVFISFSVLGSLSILLNYRRTMADKRDMMLSALQETSRYVATQHLRHGIDLDDLDISIPLTVISRISNLDIILADTDGVIKACSENILSGIDSEISPEVLELIDSGEHAVSLSTLGHIYGVPRMMSGMILSASIGGQMRTYGYLIVTGDLIVSRQEWQRFTTVFILLALSVMLLAFIISFIASRKQAKPIIEIAKTARRFARGYFDLRVENYSDRKDEIGQLAEAFNYMADSVQHNEELRRDFIANLSHELKTPMTVITGFAEGLLDGTIPKEDEARYLGIISSETRRLSRLVKSMSNISVPVDFSSEEIAGGSFDITEVVRLALLSLDSKIAAKNLDVEAAVPDDPIIARGSKDSITQVVFNLIDNAVKYSYSGSVIRLELWQQAQKVYVSITNRGDTIPADELPFIFQRFHKIDKSRGVDREGVGLGLYIVKTILDKHNEDVFVTSTDGETKFIFSLTVANP